MFWFVIGIVVLLTAVGFGIAAVARKEHALWWATIIGIVLAALLVVISSVYTQDAGEAKVKIDLSGNLAGQTTDTGFHAKAPWQHTQTFNIRNQTVTYINSESGSDSDNNGGTRTGPYITVQDKDGVSDNVAIVVQYSIDSKAVTDIYRAYKDEDNFKKNFVEQRVRSVVREVPNHFTTIDLITKRGKVESAMTAGLEKSWKGTGVHVDNLSLQEINVPGNVREAYASAQQAQVQVTKEEALLDAAKVAAQQKVVKAKAEADANREIASSLTPEVLQSKQLDTLAQLGKDGNTFVVPNGTNPLLQVK